MLCGDGNKVAVSLWLTRTIEDDEDGNYIAVIEPVQRVVANLLLDEFGMILHADEVAFSLFHTNENNFIGHNIIKWIPNIEWPVVESSLANVRIIVRSVAFFAVVCYSKHFLIEGEQVAANDRLKRIESEFPSDSTPGLL